LDRGRFARDHRAVVTTSPGSWPFVGRDADLAALRSALADPEVRAVVITAPAGAGKTRLARELCRTADPMPLWWQAAPAVSAVPFGVLADVVDLGADDPASAYRRLADDAEAAGGLVVVDDAPHLDARSADLLHRLVGAGAVTVVATARAGVGVPAWLEWLWLGEQTQHRALEPLDGAATATLVDQVLGPTEPSRHEQIVRALGERTSGNALFLREILADLRRQLDADGPLEIDAAAPPHLMRVLEARQRAAGDDVLGALQDASLLGSLPLDILEQRHDHAALAAAERAAFLVVEGTEHAVARPAHPLQAEAALGALTAGERRRRTAEVARAILGHPGSRSSERLAATTALVDIGAAVPTELLVEAARSAFAALDHELAARLAASAVAAGDPFEAKVVLGAAHSGAGRPEAAELALRDALASAGNDDERARAAGRLSVHLVAHDHRIDEATELLEQVSAIVEDPAARAFLAADQAKLASIRGDLATAAMPVADDADDLTILNSAIVGAYAQAMAGDAAACRATIVAALPLAEAHRAVLPWSAELIRFSGPFAALLEAGPEAAAAEAAQGVGATATTTEATLGTWRFLEGFTTAVAGRLESADRALGLADDDLDGHDLIGARALAVATRAWVVAQAGDTEGSRTLLDRSVDAALVDGRVRAQVAVADAWCDHHERGRVTDPVATKVIAAALDAAEGGQLLTTVIVLGELVRLGAPDQALVPLRRIARAAPDSWLVRFVVDRAAAEAAGDPAALQRLIRRATGRWPVAVAELHAACHRIAGAAGDEVGAARAAFEARRAASRLGGLVPWPLAALPPPLTEREDQVARAVAAGATSRAVAEAAGVSVRTVEHQLQSAYRKLGLAGRKDLAALLAEPAPAEPAEATVVAGA
jgi:DNA-binding CsgD family transcriptional regulator